MQQPELRESDNVGILPHGIVRGNIDYQAPLDSTLFITLRDGTTIETLFHEDEEDIKIFFAERRLRLDRPTWFGLPTEQRAVIEKLLRTGIVPEDKIRLSAFIERDQMTRNLLFNLPEDPSHTYVLSGFGAGIVEDDGALYYYEPAFEGKNVEEVLLLLGQEPMATAFILPDGSPKMVVNRGPVGAYLPERLERKVKLTRQMAQLQTGLVVPEILGYGYYSDIKFQSRGKAKENVGWLLYRAPHMIHGAKTLEVSQAVDITYPFTDPANGYKGHLIYETWLYKFMQGLNKIHKANLVHLQLHPGNKLMDITTNDNTPVLSDMETMTNISKFSGTYVGIPAKQNAIEQDISIHLWREAMSVARVYRSSYEAMAEQLTRMIAWSIHGYNYPQATKPDMRLIEELEYHILPRVTRMLGIGKGVVDQELLKFVTWPFISTVRTGEL